MAKRRNITIHVGSLEEAGRRFLKAWRRAERGEHVDEEHLSFESLEGLMAMLSPERIEVVRFVRRRPNMSIAVVARALGRDYKRVHGEVRALTTAGLLERRAARLRAPFVGANLELSF